MFTALSKSYAPFGKGTPELETTPSWEMTQKMTAAAKMRDDEEYAKEDEDDEENGR